MNLTQTGNNLNLEYEIVDGIKRIPIEVDISNCTIEDCKECKINCSDRKADAYVH